MGDQVASWGLTPPLSTSQVPAKLFVRTLHCMMPHSPACSAAMYSLPRVVQLLVCTATKAHPALHCRSIQFAATTTCSSCTQLYTSGHQHAGCIVDEGNIKDAFKPPLPH
jgi:hypothetical protein